MRQVAIPDIRILRCRLGQSMLGRDARDLQHQLELLARRLSGQLLGEFQPALGQIPVDLTMSRAL
jgi:hypothetical protein